MISRSLIKIKIRKEYTTIGYKKAVFKSRRDAVRAAILHLETILKERLSDKDKEAI